MATIGTRSAAMLISVYRDAEGGAPWYARLESFGDATRGRVRSASMTDDSELFEAIRGWLLDVIGHGDDAVTTG